jgi:hypothetical protein
MGEVRAPMQDFYQKSETHIYMTKSWENPNLSKSRRIKYLERLTYLKYIEECPLFGRV